MKTTGYCLMVPFFALQLSSGSMPAELPEVFHLIQVPGRAVENDLPVRKTPQPLTAAEGLIHELNLQRLFETAA